MTHEHNETSQDQKRRKSFFRGRWLWAVLILIAGAFAALSLLCIIQRDAPPPAVSSPVTSFEGSEVDPALSHDGERIAFSWDGGTGGTYQVYVLEIGANEPMALTHGMGNARHPAWSPDGRDIVFLRALDGGDSDVVVIPATGGSEQILTKITDTHFVGIDWSLDGEYLAFVDKEEPDDSESVFLFNIQTGSKKRLTAPATSGLGDRNPAFSNDGEYLAFVRWWEGEHNEIYIVDLAEGRQRLVAEFDGQLRGLDWLPDDSILVFSAQWRGTLGLWSVAVEHGVPIRLNYGENAHGVTVSSTSGRLAFSQRRSDTNIWRVSGLEANESSPPTRFISSTREDYGPRYSPDGGRIALTSDRSGENQIWICHNDGSHCYQLTPTGANAVGAYWSPGGESIAFTEMSRGPADVYIADVNMGIPFRLTREESIDLAGSWSADGLWVYFSSDRTGRYEVWRAPASGGDVEQITSNGGILPVVSSDGRFVYYMKLTSPRSVWRIDLESHIERLICEADIGARGFSLWKDLIIYLLQDTEEGARVEAFDMETRETHIVADLGMETRFGPYGRQSLSPDGQWILFTRQDGGGADIVLVDPFH